MWKRWGNSMKDDKSSMAGELTPGTQNRDLDRRFLLSWESLELHQRDTRTLRRARIRICIGFFRRGGIWEIRRKYERGKIFPSLIIIITVSSPFSSGQMGIGSDIFPLFLDHFFALSLFKLIPHHLRSKSSTKRFHSLPS